MYGYVFANPLQRMDPKVALGRISMRQGPPQTVVQQVAFLGLADGDNSLDGWPKWRQRRWEAPWCRREKKNLL
jgi:hypothetical protein